MVKYSCPRNDNLKINFISKRHVSRKMSGTRRFAFLMFTSRLDGDVYEQLEVMQAFISAENPEDIHFFVRQNVANVNESALHSAWDFILLQHDMAHAFAWCPHLRHMSHVSWRCIARFQKSCLPCRHTLQFCHYVFEKNSSYFSLSRVISSSCC